MPLLRSQKGAGNVGVDTAHDTYWTFTPLAAHTEHWRGRLLAHVLGSAVAGLDHDRVALNRFVEGLRSGTASASRR